MKEKEYIVIKDVENDKVVGRKEVRSKIALTNVAAYVINGTLLYGYGEFNEMQELAKNIPDIEDFKIPINAEEDNNSEYEESLFFPKEGDIVWDDLTASKAKIIKVSGDKGCLGYWLDNDYLGGGRHPWEISKVKEKQSIHSCMECGELHSNGQSSFCGKSCERKFIRWQEK